VATWSLMRSHDSLMLYSDYVLHQHRAVLIGH
jgi:hypothetical protein